jgi:universal stress protein A
MKEISDSLSTPANLADQLTAVPKLHFEHLLAATDFSPGSRRAVDCAIRLARSLGAQLTLLHIVPEPSPLDYTMGGYPLEEMRAREKESEENLLEQLKLAQLEYKEVDSLQLSALQPWSQIVSSASDLSADLLIISTHGYTGWRHFLFGSDAEKIIDHAACPVLVVR